MTPNSKPLLAFVALAALQFPAHAGTVVGGSTLLDPSGVSQIEAWLGRGPITLTNAFTKTPGATSFNFHSAVDGGGETITVMFATEENTGKSAVIGGYNPVAWSAYGRYVVNPDPADRTAFVFNLTDGRIYRQRGDLPGQYQTYNHGSYGPTFGGGHDIYVDTALGYGYSYLYSYDGVEVTHSVVDLSNYSGGDMRIGALEVFWISASPVPEPETYAMFLAGLGLIGAAARRRKTAG